MDYNGASVIGRPVGELPKLKNAKILWASGGFFCDSKSNVLYNARMLVEGDLADLGCAVAGIASLGCAELGCYG